MRQAALNSVYDLAKRDQRVVFVGSDLGPSVLAGMKKSMPERFFMEGVSEQALVSIAAGMALEGFIPYVNTIATFLTRRCFEQVAVDVCLHDLPVRLIANGGGLVYAPLGPTHLAIEDIGILRTLPNMTICAVCDADEMRRLIDASLAWPHPMYIRLGKGGDAVVSDAARGFAIGKAISVRAGGKVLAVSTGIMTQRALAVATLLEASGIEMGVLHVHTIKPLDTEALLDAAAGAELIVTMEEHVLAGGLGSAVAETFTDRRCPVPLLRLGLPDAFPHGFGNQDNLLGLAGLTPAAMADAIRGALKRT